MTGRQLFLYEPLVDREALERDASREFRILNWNIRNPSLRRAREQSKWIMESQCNIVVLTEARYSDGCRAIRDVLESYAYEVWLPEPNGDDYCVIVAVRGVPARPMAVNAPFLPHRFITMTIGRRESERIRIVGTYVPSRGPLEHRNEAKRRFQREVESILPNLVGTDGRVVVCGDLNVVPRNHVPHYDVFGEWEYRFYDAFQTAGMADAYLLEERKLMEHSWFGRRGDGYRFDHFFVGAPLRERVVRCIYDHSPRMSGLSDHSAMILLLSTGR